MPTINLKDISGLHFLNAASVGVLNGVASVQFPLPTTSAPIGGVTKLVEGTGITLSPTGGTGVVTVNSTASPVNFSDVETPSGLLNSSNVTYTLTNAPNPPASLNLFLNGIWQLEGAGNDYALSGNTITMGVAPPSTYVMRASYRY
jgi:hypothetical protein